MGTAGRDSGMEIRKGNRTDLSSRMFRAWPDLQCNPTPQLYPRISVLSSTHKVNTSDGTQNTRMAHT